MRLLEGEWVKLRRHIDGHFYEPLTADEMMHVVQALEFSHRGHYYTCPNGHPYVIADCGGAAQRAICPECGASIGGANHELVAGNSRAMEFENLARQAGAAANPFPWGQGA
jgi:hypothetical protein